MMKIYKKLVQKEQQKHSQAEECLSLIICISWKIFWREKEKETFFFWEKKWKQF